MRISSKIVTGIVGVALALSVTACGSGYDQTHNHNTPPGQYVAPDNQVIEFPYGFDNVARACVSGDGVYMPYGGKTAFVVPADPACKGVQ